MLQGNNKDVANLSFSQEGRYRLRKWHRFCKLIQVLTEKYRENKYKREQSGSGINIARKS